MVRIGASPDGTGREGTLPRFGRALSSGGQGVLEIYEKLAAGRAAGRRLFLSHRGARSIDRRRRVQILACVSAIEEVVCLLAGGDRLGNVRRRRSGNPILVHGASLGCVPSSHARRRRRTALGAERARPRNRGRTARAWSFHAFPSR